jgi:uncharacterized protein (DUF58 family)
MTVDQQESREPTIFNSLLVLFFVGIFLFVALLYRQNDLSLLAILVLVVVGGAKAWSSMSLSRIRCDSTLDTQRVFPGDSVTLATTVENRKWLPVWLRIMWSFDGALKPAGVNGHIIRQEASVLWHQTVKFSQDFVALRRGVYQVGPPRIKTSDFLGFFEKEKSTRDATQIIVYPRLVRLRPIDIRRRDLFGVPGARSPVKDPIYILGTRDYQPFRPARHIHWKASARHLRLQEKIFEPSSQAKVLLTLDVRSFEKSVQKECFEHTLQVVASLAVRLDGMGYALGFAANGILKGGGSSAIPLSRGPRQIPAILETLARMQTMPNGPMTQVIRQSLGSQRGVTCVHFCYEDGPTVSDMEKLFQQRQIPAIFLICRRDPIAQPPQRKKGFYRYSIDEIRLDEGHPS